MADERAGLRFLINPSSGGRRRRRRLRDAIERASARDGAGVERSTSGADLTARARRAVEEGVARLVVAGGDGTVHLAVQAVAGSGVELAILPTGRGDDFALSAGIPRRPADALGLALEGEARPLDLGWVRWGGGSARFAAYAGVGFDSAAAEVANRQPRWLPTGLTYVLAVLRTLVGFRAPEIRLTHDGGEWRGRVMFATACNAPRFGGGMRIAPEARLADGRLDLVVVREVGRLELLRVFPRVFSGSHLGHPAVTVFRTRRARVEVEPPALLGSDGELLDRVGAIEVGVEPGALRLVAPSGAPTAAGAPGA